MRERSVITNNLCGESIGKRQDNITSFNLIVKENNTSIDMTRLSYERERERGTTCTCKTIIGRAIDCWIAFVVSFDVGVDGMEGITTGS
jgi:hypothetical protein